LKISSHSEKKITLWLAMRKMSRPAAFCSSLFSLSLLLLFHTTESKPYPFLKPIPQVASNGTCLFVTAIDQFGDGWGIQSNLQYWIEIGQVEGQSYKLNLTNCNTTIIQGCLPANYQLDHLAYLKFTTFDSRTGLEIVPEYYWEILWRVQIYYQAQEITEYYGGYSTSMVFRFSAQQQKYFLLYSNNLWVYPETAGTSIDSCADIQAGLFSCACRLKPTNCQHFQIQATGNVENDQFYLSDEIYQSVGWYISNNDAPTYFNLVDYGIPWSSTMVSPVICSVCLSDGSYTFRTTGSYYYSLYAEKANTLWWTFCGQSGSVQTHMEFRIVNGVCVVDTINYLSQICGGGTCQIVNNTIESDHIVSTVNMFTNSPPSSIWLEGGFTQITDTYWVHISTLTNKFQYPAVFISLPDIPGETSSSGYPAIARICNVISHGFVTFQVKIYQANDSYCSKQWRVPTNIVTPLAVSWLVVEKGSYNLGGNLFFIGSGDVYRVNSVATDSQNYVRLNYPTGCGGVVGGECAFPNSGNIGFISQLQTLIYDRLIIPRGYSAQRRFIRVVLQPHDSTNAAYYAMPIAETLAYFAFQDGVSITCIENITLETHIFNNVTHLPVSVTYKYIYDVPPGVFGMVGTSNSLTDSTGLRSFSRTLFGAKIITQEDQCVDEETAHTTGERVFALIVGTQGQRDACRNCGVKFVPEDGDPTTSPTRVPTQKPSVNSPTSIVPTRIPTLAPVAAPTCVRYSYAGEFFFLV
jgi:hypothetical protein